MNPQPVSLADELRKLVERLPRYTPEADSDAQIVMVKSSNGYWIMREVLLTNLQTLLAQHAQPEAPVGLTPELTLGDLDAALVNYDSGYTRREVVLMRLNSMLRTRTALLTAQQPDKPVTSRTAILAEEEAANCPICQQPAQERASDLAQKIIDLVSDAYGGDAPTFYKEALEELCSDALATAAKLAREEMAT